MKRMASRATELQQLALARWADQLATKISCFLAKASIFLQLEDDDNVKSDVSDEDSNVRDEDVIDDLGAKRPD